MQFRAVPLRRLAVDASVARWWPLARPDEDETAGRHPRSAGDLQDHAPALLLERILQEPIGRAQVLHRDTRSLEPFRRNATGEYERAVALSFVCEEIERSADEVRGDPPMRHVADEARLPGIAAHHLGPLVPRHRTTAGQEERQELVRPVAPTQADERADRPDLVRRVVLPRGPTVPPVDELAPVPFIRRDDQ